MHEIRIGIFILALLLPLGLAAQVNSTDTLQAISDPGVEIQMRKLDSLYQHWLTGRLPVRVYVDSFAPVNIPINDPRLSDELLRDRLLAIPSGIPLSYNDKVKDYIRSFLGSRGKQLSLLLGLADYYFPMIEPILDVYNLPEEFKYMPIIESGLDPLAYSKAGARGLWQFMHGTARLQKLTMNSYVDERHDPVRSTEAACAYISQLYGIFNDWILVIAAYNCGPGNVNKAIRRSGGKTNYWDIYPYLPRETRGHVPAFIAMVYVMNYAWDYGIQALPPSMPLITDTVHVHRSLHFGQISSLLDIPSSTLQALNPVYRKNMIPAAGGPYPLILPTDKINAYIDHEDSIHYYQYTRYFGQNTIDQSPATRVAPSPPPAGNYTKLTYTVKSGDNLGYIAQWYGVGLSLLKDWNGLNGNVIRSGQQLAVYVPDARAEALKGIDQMTFAEKQALIGQPVAAAEEIKVDKPAEGVVADTGADQFVYYTVKSGDNLWSIARKFEGVSDSDIMRLNQLANSKLKIGQKLKIKPKEG